MKIQCDYKKRVVALTNLQAMCERISGTCHRFSVVKVTPHTVYVEYSNPNEYGTEYPMQAVFPAWQTEAWQAEGKDTYIVLDILRVQNDSEDGGGWQNFQQLIDCPELFRSTIESNEWLSREEWSKRLEVKTGESVNS
jgi:hypothetical protein